MLAPWKPHLVRTLSEPSQHARTLSATLSAAHVSMNSGWRAWLVTTHLWQLLITNSRVHYRHWQKKEMNQGVACNEEWSHLNFSCACSLSLTLASVCISHIDHWSMITIAYTSYTYWPFIGNFFSYFKASISCKAEMKVVKERIQRGDECPDDALASMMHKMHLSEFLAMTLFMWWWSLWIW